MVDNTLRQCSFRGVQFYLDTISDSSGRRLSVDDFPYQDISYIEDLGKTTKRLRISGYLAGNLVSGEPFLDLQKKKEALENAFNIKGSGILELSYYKKRLQVFVGSVSFELNNTSATNFSAEFYLDENQEITITQTQRTINTFNLIEQYQNNIVSSLTDLIYFNPTADYAQNRFSNLFNNIKSNLTNLVQSISFTDLDISSQITDKLEKLVSNNYLDSFDILKDIAINEKEGSQINNVIEGLVFTPQNDEISQSNSKTFADTINSERILSHAYKQFLIVIYASMVFQETFTSRNQAIYHRAYLSDLMYSEHDYIETNTFDLFTDIINAASTFITDNLTNFRAIVTIEGHNAFLPASYWSYRLYGDLDHVDDLVQRNNITDPDFMPLSFEALSP